MVVKIALNVIFVASMLGRPDKTPRMLAADSPVTAPESIHSAGGTHADGVR